MDRDFAEVIRNGKVRVSVIKNTVYSILHCIHRTRNRWRKRNYCISSNFCPTGRRIDWLHILQSELLVEHFHNQ